MNIYDSRAEVYCPGCKVLIGYEVRIADTPFFDFGDGFIRSWGHIDCPRCNSRLYRRINVGKFIQKAQKLLERNLLDQQSKELVEGLVMGFLEQKVTYGHE